VDSLREGKSGHLERKRIAQFTIYSPQTARRLSIIFERANTSWNVERRAIGKALYEKYVTELPVIENETEAARNERLIAVKLRVADELVERNTELLLTAVRNEFKDQNEAEAIIQHLLAVRQVLMVTTQVDTEIQRQIAVYTNKLQKDYPIRSRIASWLQKNVSKEAERLGQQYQWEVHERLLKIFDDKGWEQQAFFLRFFLRKVRDGQFHKAVEKEYVNSRAKKISGKNVDNDTYRLQKVKEPNHTFYWRRFIWRPKNWIIKRNEFDNRYYAEKVQTTETNTKQWFWVWRNYYERITTWWNNSLVVLVYSMLNCKRPQPLFF